MGECDLLFPPERTGSILCVTCTIEAAKLYIELEGNLGSNLEVLVELSQ